MDVLLCLTAEGHGGVESHTVALAEGLSAAGHSVCLTSQRKLHFDVDLRKRLEDCGAELFSPPPLANTSRYGGLVFARWVLAEQLRGKRFDVVVGNGHGAAFLWLGRFLKQDGHLIWHEVWYGVPTRGDHYQNGYAAPPLRRLGYPMRRVLARVDGVITTTGRSVENLRTIQAAICPIAVARPLVALGRPPLEEDRRYNPASRLQFAFVGRLGYGKGVGALLDAWDAASIDNAELHFYGRFPDPAVEQELKARAERCSGVAFHGAFETREISGILRDADIGVMASMEEGFGLVALEYMWAGLPFIMTDVGAAREFTADCPDSLRVEVDPEALTAGLKEMSERVRSNRTSRVRLQTRYSSHFDECDASAHQIHLLSTHPSHWESCGWPSCTDREQLEPH